MSAEKQVRTRFSRVVIFILVPAVVIWSIVVVVLSIHSITQEKPEAEFSDIESLSGEWANTSDDHFRGVIKKIVINRDGKGYWVNGAKRENIARARIIGGRLGLSFDGGDYWQFYGHLRDDGQILFLKTDFDTWVFERTN